MNIENTRESTFERATKLVKMWVDDKKRDGLADVQAHINLIILIADELSLAEQLGFDEGFEQADVAHIDNALENDDEAEDIPIQF